MREEALLGASSVILKMGLNYNEPLHVLEDLWLL